MPRVHLYDLRLCMCTHAYVKSVWRFYVYCVVLLFPALQSDEINWHEPVKTRCFKMSRRVRTSKDTVFQNITVDAND
jgi:hypothetical protein